MASKYSKAFEDWWNENKQSDLLHYEYADYCQDMKSLGEKALTFKKWAFDSAYQED